MLNFSCGFMSLACSVLAKHLFDLALDQFDLVWPSYLSVVL